MTRFVTALAVLVVAAVAGLISFGHIETVALAYGQPVLAARLLPVSVDGALVAASMVLLDYARRGLPAPALARILLALGVAATLGSNAVSGLAHGPVGVMVATLPALFFIGSVETFLSMVRGHAQEAPASANEAPAAEALLRSDPEALGPIQAVPARPPAPRTRARRPLPVNRPTSRGMTLPPAEVFAEELGSGKVPGIRSIKSRCRVGQPRAETIQADLAAFIEARTATMESN